MPIDNVLATVFRRLTTPQETLDRRIFDYREMMIPYVREQLLAKVNAVIKILFSDVSGLVVDDICLVGSSASYFYREESDIDIRIEMHNKSCQFLSDNPKKLNDFLLTISTGFNKMGNKRTFNGRLLDIKASIKSTDVTGQYSIKNNTWRVYPNKDIAMKINCDEFLQQYQAHKDVVCSKIENLSKNYTGVELAKKLDDFYIQLFDYNNKFEKLLMFKLLNSERLLQKIGALSVSFYNAGLSFPECLPEDDVQKTLEAFKPKVEKKSNSKEECLYLLKPQKTLNPFIFDEHKKMRSEVRKKILSRVEHVINFTLAKIEGLEVVDICLTGSMSSYFYRENSDIDIRIEVKNKSCPFLGDNEQQFNSFLSTMVNGWRCIGFLACVDGKRMDIKASCRQNDVIGLYSVKYDKWRIYPDEDLFANINFDDTMAETLLQKKESENYLEYLKNTYDTYTCAQKNDKYYQKLYYDVSASPETTEQIEKSGRMCKNLANGEYIAKRHLLYKLLGKSGFLSYLGSECVVQYQKALSLYKK